MAYQFKLQIPISRELNKKLKSRAAKAGLSSVSDVARLLLTDYANGNLVISVTKNMPDEDSLDYDLAELDKIVTQGMAEHKAGKTKSLDFSKNIHEQLMAD